MFQEKNAKFLGQDLQGQAKNDPVKVGNAVIYRIIKLFYVREFKWKVSRFYGVMTKRLALWTLIPAPCKKQLYPYDFKIDLPIQGN